MVDQGEKMETGGSNFPKNIIPKPMAMAPRFQMVPRPRPQVPSMSMPLYNTNPNIGSKTNAVSSSTNKSDLSGSITSKEESTTTPAAPKKLPLPSLTLKAPPETTSGQKMQLSGYSTPNFFKGGPTHMQAFQSPLNSRRPDQNCTAPSLNVSSPGVKPVLFKVPEIPNRVMAPQTPETTPEKPQERLDDGSLSQVIGQRSKGASLDDNRLDSRENSSEVDPLDELPGEDDYKLQNMDTIQDIFGDFCARFRDVEKQYHEMKVAHQMEYEILSEKNKQIKDEKERLEMEIDTLRKTLEGKTRQISEIKCQESTLHEKCQAFESQIEAKNEYLKKLEEKNEHVLKQIASLEAELKLTQEKSSKEHLDNLKDIVREELDPVKDKSDLVCGLIEKQGQWLKDTHQDQDANLRDLRSELNMFRELWETHHREEKDKLVAQVKQLEDDKSKFNEEMLFWKSKYEKMESDNLAEESKLSDEVNRLKSSFEKAQSQISRLEELLESTEKDLEAMRTAEGLVSLELKQARDHWKDEKGKLEEAKIVLAEQVNQLKDRIETQEQERREYMTFVNEQMKVVQEEKTVHLKKMQTLESQLKESIDELNMSQKANAELQGNNRAMTEKVAEQMKEIGSYQAQALATNLKIQNLEAAIETLQSELHRLTEASSEQDKLQKDIDAMEEKLKNMEDENRRLIKASKSRQKQACAGCSENEKLKADLASINKQLQETEEKGEKVQQRLQTEISGLQQRLSQQQEQFQKDLDERQANWKRISEVRENETRNLILQKDNRISQLENQLKQYESMPKSPLMRQSLTQIALTGNVPPTSDTETVKLLRHHSATRDDSKLDDLFDMDALESLELPEQPLSSNSFAVDQKSFKFKQPSFNTRKRKERGEPISIDRKPAEDTESKRVSLRKPKNKMRRGSSSRTSVDIFDHLD